LIELRRNISFSDQFFLLIIFGPYNAPLTRKPLSGVATPRSARRLRKQTA